MTDMQYRQNCKADQNDFINFLLNIGTVSGVGLFVYFMIWLTKKLNELPSPPMPPETTTPILDRHVIKPPPQG
ncbi:hypothetical protein B5X24_HaOG207218 [Helicoverpa armigera]|nr:hypothetical protein B5X24_HaOG207218 [Helicoverpa armigera]